MKDTNGKIIRERWVDKWGIIIWAIGIIFTAGIAWAGIISNTNRICEVEIVADKNKTGITELKAHYSDIVRWLERIDGKL